MISQWPGLYPTRSPGHHLHAGRERVGKLDTESRSEATTERVPPNNVDAERAVIGAVLQKDGGAAALDIVISTGLKIKHFYNTSHQKIYQAILRLHDSGTPVDLVTLTTELEQTGAHIDASIPPCFR